MLAPSVTSGESGSVLVYPVAASLDLLQWSSALGGLTTTGPARNAFDGTGTSFVTYRLTLPAGSPGQGYVRAQVLSRS